jgi:tetratricopeptide (TPR) repeat protein
MALADMDKAVEMEPKKSYRYSSRAYIKGSFGRTVEAIADYKIAIQLDPEDAIAHNNLGLLEEQLGYKDKAKLSFKNADQLAGINIGREDLGLEGEEIPARNIQKEIEEEREKTTLWSTIKSLNSKEGKASFVRFVKSGFKKT